MTFEIRYKSKPVAKVVMAFEGATMYPDRIDRLVGVPDLESIVRRSTSAVSVHYYSLKKRPPVMRVDDDIELHVDWD